jgi:hypothetical protein
LTGNGKPPRAARHASKYGWAAASKRFAHPLGVAHRQRDFVQHVQTSRAFDLTNQRGHRIDIEIQGPGQSVQVRFELQTLVRAALFIEGVIAGAGKNIQIFTQHFLPVELFVVLGLQALVIFRVDLQDGDVFHRPGH